MNNTKSLTAIAAIVIAAALVVGGTLAATSAFAYQKRGGGQENSNNGNTVTIEECKNRGFASGFDTKVNQEYENLICTHPGSDATCVSEPGKVTPPPTPKPTMGTLVVKKIVECKDDMIRSIIRKCPNPEDFAITVTGNSPDPASFDGSESGTPVKLAVGHYEVTEDEHEGFTADFSPDCDSTIAPGDQKTCTITNTEKERLVQQQLLIYNTPRGNQLTLTSRHLFYFLFIYIAPTFKLPVGSSQSILQMCIMFPKSVYTFNPALRLQSQ